MYQKYLHLNRKFSATANYKSVKSTSSVIDSAKSAAMRAFDRA